jgi:hypothetical protein
MMDIKQYSQEVMGIIDDLTDDQFMEMLTESGLEACPLDNTTVSIHIKVSQVGVYYSGFYSTKNDGNSFLINQKVA